jgi:L-arabinose isomerase
MNNRMPIVGLLPLYLELYDKSSPEMRPNIEGFYRKATNRLRDAGLDVLTAPICRLADEFASTLGEFEKKQADAVVTLHLAYSPSMESEDALRKTTLPIIILDTTPDYTFDQNIGLDAISYNHGIHGVQDMCNLLLRNNKTFIICAGHMDHSDVIKRVVKAATVSVMLRVFKNSRVGLVGKPFKGMGDFSIPIEEMKKDLGITVIPYDFEKGASYIGLITQDEIDAEYQYDSKRFEIDSNLSRKVYDRSARVCLAIRKWYKEEKLTALTINFSESSSGNKGFPIMPFTECSTAMSEGLGYAGEGDVLTAAFIGALLSVFKEATFTEMFCPAWEHGAVFMSHMGEYNFSIASGKPFLTEKPFPFTDAENPTVAYKTMKEGEATLINFAPFGKGVYGITIALGEMLPVSGENKMRLAVNGWFRPGMELGSFLEAYSRCGGTHHGVLVYGDVREEMKMLALYLGCKINLLN